MAALGAKACRCSRRKVCYSNPSPEGVPWRISSGVASGLATECTLAWHDWLPSGSTCPEGCLIGKESCTAQPQQHTRASLRTHAQEHSTRRVLCVLQFSHAAGQRQRLSFSWNLRPQRHAAQPMAAHASSEQPSGNSQCATPCMRQHGCSAPASGHMHVS